MGNSAAKGVFFNMPKIADVTSVKSNITPKALDQADQGTLSSKNLLGTLESKKSALDTKLAQLLIETPAKTEESSDYFKFNAALDRANESELIEAATQNLLAAPTFALPRDDAMLAKTAILYFIAFRRSAIKRTKECVGILKPTTIDMLVGGFEAEIKILQSVAKELDIRVPHAAFREKPSDELLSKLILDPLFDEIIRDVLFWYYPEELDELGVDYDALSLEFDRNSAEPEDYDSDDEDADAEFDEDEEEETDLEADDEDLSEEDDDLDVDAEDFEDMDDNQEEENDEDEDLEAGADDIEEMDMEDEAEEENDESEDENEDDDEEEDDEENDDIEENEEELDIEDELENDDVEDDISDELDADAEDATELDDENQFEEAGAPEENEAVTMDGSEIDSSEAQDTDANEQLIQLAEEVSYNIEFLMRYLDSLLENSYPLYANATPADYQELFAQMDYQPTRLSL